VNPEQTPAGVRPLLYAGRFAGQVSASELSDDCLVLNDWEVLPGQLAAVLGEAGALVVLDPLSFPFETMPAEGWDVPLAVYLPPDYGAEFVRDVFEEPVLKRLGFFDRLVVRDDALWEDLRARHRWAEGQRLLPGGATPGEVAAGVLDHLASGAVDPDGRRGALGPGLAFEKAVHRAQGAVLGPQFAAALGEASGGTPLDVLEVGCGDGRWAASFDPAAARFCGVDADGRMVEAARVNFPEGRFDPFGPEAGLPHEAESFDLVFGVGLLHHEPAAMKRALISEMWRVARPGGRLMFLEDFVAGREGPGAPAHPVSVLRFVDVLLEATNGQVVLEHVQSLRYPGDDVVRGGLISVSRLGVPARW
jgi:hypothetical protein